VPEHRIVHRLQSWSKYLRRTHAIPPDVAVSDCHSRIGTTGFIGGDAFHAIAHAHPDVEWVCLARNSEKAGRIAAQYPKVRIVYGDLDSSDVLEEESRNADIVCHWANADHEGAAKAIVKGLSAKTSPGYLIHTSGTGVLLFNDIDRDVYGEASDKIYNDWDGVSEVTNLPDHAPHRVVDKIVLEAGIKHADIVKTAIVCPPTIYGQGRGPDNQRSHQVPELSRVTIEQGHGLMIGQGKTFWTSVHVHDLSDCYLKLVEAAINGGKPATWGAEGYYFTENGDIVWGEVSQWVAAAAKKQGWIQDDKVLSMSKEDANKKTRMGSAMWGANSRARAVRARKLLGWTTKEESLEDNVPRTVEIEAKRLGRGHAAKAAGDA